MIHEDARALTKEDLVGHQLELVAKLKSLIPDLQKTKDPQKMSEQILALRDLEKEFGRDFIERSSAGYEADLLEALDSVDMGSEMSESISGTLKGLMSRVEKKLKEEQAARAEKAQKTVAGLQLVTPEQSTARSKQREADAKRDTTNEAGEEILALLLSDKPSRLEQASMLVSQCDADAMDSSLLRKYKVALQNTDVTAIPHRAVRQFLLDVQARMTGLKSMVDSAGRDLLLPQGVGVISLDDVLAKAERSQENAGFILDSLQNTAVDFESRCNAASVFVDNCDVDDLDEQMLHRYEQALFKLAMQGVSFEMIPNTALRNFLTNVQVRFDVVQNRIDAESPQAKPDVLEKPAVAASEGPRTQFLKPGVTPEGKAKGLKRVDRVRPEPVAPPQPERNEAQNVESALSTLEKFVQEPEASAYFTRGIMALREANFDAVPDDIRKRVGKVLTAVESVLSEDMMKDPTFLKAIEDIRTRAHVKNFFQKLFSR